MKKLIAFIACSLCGCAEFEHIVSNIQPSTKKDTIEAVQQDYFIIQNKKGKQYIVSNETMDWERAYRWCDAKGLQMVDQYYRDNRGIIRGNVCNISNSIPILDIEKGKYDKLNSCTAFAGLTKEDIYVWLHPTLDAGMRSLVINLKTGGYRISKIKNWDTLSWGSIPYVASHAICEKTQE